MVPVVVPALGEYAACWLRESRVLVSRAGVGTLLGFGTAGTSSVWGCGVVSWICLRMVKQSAHVVGCGCVWGLLFENCIVDASILFFVAALFEAGHPPGWLVEVW